MGNSNICFYCEKNSVLTRDYNYQVVMKKDIDSKIGIGVTGFKKTTTFQQQKLEIPRCPDCAKIHSAGNKPAVIFGLIIAVIAAVVGYFLGQRVYIAVIAFIVGYLVGMIAHISIVYRGKIKKFGTKDALEVHEHQEVKEMEEDGWEIKLT